MIDQVREPTSGSDRSGPNGTMFEPRPITSISPAGRSVLASLFHRAESPRASGTRADIGPNSLITEKNVPFSGYGREAQILPASVWDIRAKQTATNGGGRLTYETR